MSSSVANLLFFSFAIAVGCGSSDESVRSRTNLAESVAVQASRREATAIGLVKAINSADPTALETFAEKFTDPEVAKQVPISKRLEVLLSVKQMTGKIEVRGVNELEEGEFILEVTTEKQGPRQMRVIVGGPPTFGMQSVQVGAPDSFSARPTLFENVTTLAELADRAFKEGKAPAIALVRVAADGEPEVEVRGVRRFGTSEAVAKDDLWLVGSIGKSMTATMIARLVDQGKLMWTTTLGEAFEGVPMKDAYRKVTLLQLVQHRGGIPQDMGVRPGGALTPEDVQNLAAGAKSDREVRERYAKHILGREPAGPVGEFRYSNAGYALASVMAEQAANRAFPELMRSLLFEPLGMTSARIATPASEGMPGSSGQNSGHRMAAGKPSPHSLSFGPMSQMFAAAGGGVAMTIGDLAKYGQFHLRGLLGKANLMSQANFDRLHAAAEGPGEAYGAGWSISPTQAGDKLHHHNGSDGTFQADLAIAPKRNLVVACIQNMGEEAIQPMPEKVVISLVRAARPK